MMTHWLQDETNKLPDYASHYIGVGGFVQNEKGELLVVSEKYWNEPHWKLPDAGESLVQGVIREVKEETGIDCAFISIICVRHRIKAFFEKGDMYWILRLKPLNEEINMDSSELSRCQWLPISDYISHPHVNNLNKQVAILALKNEDLMVHEMKSFPFVGYDGVSTDYLYQQFDPLIINQSASH
eukprot:TRINITY_DN6356_c0_g1_i1.p1 TRINITY_DN6356_c0_g1~~TRINITY_DN6356_c0_g1_i1.p1  ORF type:complete len:184 (-),score=21.97 TRINITY_DN6356_c0_g1_i1:17-568(-)